MKYLVRKLQLTVCIHFITEVFVMEDPILQKATYSAVVNDSGSNALVDASVTLSPATTGGSGLTNSTGTATMIVSSSQSYTGVASMTGYTTSAPKPAGTNVVYNLALAPGNGSLIVTVKGTEDAVLSGAVVTTKSGDKSYSQDTNSSGVAAIGLAPGEYSVTATASGYTTSAVHTETVTAGGSKSFTITLVASS